MAVAKVKSSVQVTAEIIYEDGFVRVEVRAGRPSSEKWAHPISDALIAETLRRVDKELRKFLPRKLLA